MSVDPEPFHFARMERSRVSVAARSDARDIACACRDEM
jgi:hypothetical protein